jgi:Uma2 family endonuclease
MRVEEMNLAEMLDLLRTGIWWNDEPGEIVAIPLGRTATIDDLRITKLKAEIVDGQLIVIAPSSDAAGRAASSIVFSLHEHQKRFGGGRVFGSSVAYVVDLPHRLAFCPDAAWYTGPKWDDFPRGAPVFAVEVRERSEVGPAAEERLAAKRADYFVAGTKVVWDVDVLGGEDVVRAYRADDPDHPTIFHRGEIADAEPAVPGWTMPVDELFL